MSGIWAEKLGAGGLAGEDVEDQLVAATGDGHGQAPGRRGARPRSDPPVTSSTGRARGDAGQQLARAEVEAGRAPGPRPRDGGPGP